MKKFIVLAVAAVVLFASCGTRQAKAEAEVAVDSLEVAAADSLAAADSVAVADTTVLE